MESSHLSKQLHSELYKDNTSVLTGVPTSHKDTSPASFCHTVQTEKRRKRKTSRALVLQGGGALGAYEVGVLKFLSESLRNEDERRGDANRPLFDIVAGSSMGAVNAAILVHNVTSSKTQRQNPNNVWTNAIEKLHDFYMELSDPDFCHPLWWINKVCLENHMFEQFWTVSDYFKKLFFTINSAFFEFSQSIQKNALLQDSTRQNEYELFPSFQCASLLTQKEYRMLPTPENARRYYYYLSSILFGIPKVLSPAVIQPDLSYCDPLWTTHVYTRFSNEPLIKTMKKFWDYEKFPIKTKPGQPRLLLVAVDVEDSSMPVVIDSYAKDRKNRLLYSEYGHSMQYRLEYQSGVTADHVRASVSTPLRHEYPSFSVYNKETRQHEIRHFWDGAFISNSPVLELIKAHTDYWQKQSASGMPPDLELYVVSLFPTVKKGIPGEPYSIQDRETDLKFQNRLVLDDVANEINTRSALEGAIDSLIGHCCKNNLEIPPVMPISTRSKFPNSLNRGKRTPAIVKIVSVERHEGSEDSVFGKVFDFSRKSITKLIDDGYRDAKKIVEK